MDSSSVTENVAVEVLAALIAAAIIGIVSFLAGRSFWRIIRNNIRAFLIRKTTGLAFTIVRCPISHDDTGTIGSEIGIRLETAFRVFAGWDTDETRPFKVIQLPLELPSGQSTKGYDKAVETAKRWLEKTDGDILIWGERVKGDSIGFIRLVGKDRKKGIVEERRIDFDKQATHFDEALATAIAYEAAQLTQVTLSEPALSNLDALRTVSVKLRKLAEAAAPALSRNWRERMATEHRRLLEEIIRRSPHHDGLIKLEENARAEIGTIIQAEAPRHFAETSLRIGILVRKRNWLDPNKAELNEAADLVSGAASFFQSHGSVEQATNCSLERLLIRRQELSLLGEEESESDVFYSKLFRETTSLVDSINLENQRSRLTAVSFCPPQTNTITEVYPSSADQIENIFRFVQRVARFLDNQELLDFVMAIRSQVFSEGDRLQSVAMWRIAVEILDAAIESRASWTEDEERYLKSAIAASCATSAQRIERLSGSYAARPYYDRVIRIAEEIDGSFDWRHLSEFRLVDLKTLKNFRFNISDENQGSYLHERAIDAFKICIDPKTKRFPRLHREARVGFAVILNNIAVERQSLEAAEEALKCIAELNKKQETDNAFVDYVTAFSMWQIARLTALSASEQREERGLQAHLKAQEALGKAIQRNDQTLISLTHEILRMIEADFPGLAVDLRAEAVEAGDGSRTGQDRTPSGSG